MDPWKVKREPSVRVVSRPHNWRPKQTTEALLLIDLKTKRLLREVVIPSRFTHDAVRAGDSVFLADTGGGHVYELDIRDMERGAVREAAFTFKEHVNTLAPAGIPDKPHAVWALLHNLGPSKLVLADLATGGAGRSTPKQHTTTCSLD